MSRTRSRRALSASTMESAATAVPRTAEELTAELQRLQLVQHEDAASFAQTLARLAQSERALSQTKAKLVDAETRAVTAEARVSQAAAMAESAEAKLLEAEAREREALIAAQEASEEKAALLLEIAELKRGVRPSAAQDLSRELASAEQRIDVLTHERERLLELLSSLEVLGREITHLTTQASVNSPALPKAEVWLGRDLEAEHVRATMRPEGLSAPPRAAVRSWSTPEISIDGLKLES
jgi:DNA repair exonuclease SbcCD ATPase subunit